MVDLTTLTIAEASRLMEGKELSPVELTQAALQRISTLNPRLNAFITVLEDRASAAAKAAEQEMMSGQRRGPLHGIPIALRSLRHQECVPLRGRRFSEITYHRMMRRLPSAWQRRGRFCSVNST